jgi:hypothetical protein
MINYIRLFQDYHMDMPESLISQNSLYDPLTNALNIYSFRVISGIFLKNIRELEEKAREFQKRGVDIIYFNITSLISLPSSPITRNMDLSGAARQSASLQISLPKLFQIVWLQGLQRISSLLWLFLTSQ